MLPSVADWIRVLWRISGKSVTASTSITPPGLVGGITLELPADRSAHKAPGTITPDHIAGAERQSFTTPCIVLALQGHTYGMLGSRLRDIETGDFQIVIGDQPRRRLTHNVQVEVMDPGPGSGSCAAFPTGRPPRPGRDRHGRCARDGPDPVSRTWSPPRCIPGGSPFRQSRKH